MNIPETYSFQKNSKLDTGALNGSVLMHMTEPKAQILNEISVGMQLRMVIKNEPIQKEEFNQLNRRKVKEEMKSQANIQNLGNALAKPAKPDDQIKSTLDGNNTLKSRVPNEAKTL